MKYPHIFLCINLFCLPGLGACVEKTRLPEGTFAVNTYTPTGLEPAASCEALRKIAVDTVVRALGFDRVIVYEKYTGFMWDSLSYDGNLLSRTGKNRNLPSAPLDAGGTDRTDYVQTDQNLAFYQTDSGLYAFDTSSLTLLILEDAEGLRLGLYHDNNRQLWSLRQDENFSSVRVAHLLPGSGNLFVPKDSIVLRGRYLYTRKTGNRLLLVQERSFGNLLEDYADAARMYYKLEEKWQNSRDPGYYLLSEKELRPIRNQLAATLDLARVTELVGSGSDHDNDCSSVLLPASKFASPVMTQITMLDTHLHTVSQFKLFGTGNDIYMNKEFLILAGWGDWAEDRDITRSPIYAFSLSENTLAYKGFAVVNGRIPSSQALQITQDTLLVASQIDTPESYVEINSFDMSGGIPQPLDTLSPIALGASLSSTYFMKNTLFMLTDRETDPLFAVDTTDPRGLVQVGKSAIPDSGFYMRILPEDLLLTADFSSNEKGMDGALSLETFDMGDPIVPLPIDRFVFGENVGAWLESPVLYDVQALAWSADWRLLALPYSQLHDTGQPGTNYSRLAMIEVDLQGNIRPRADILAGTSENIDSEFDCGGEVCKTTEFVPPPALLERSIFDYKHNSVLAFSAGEILRLDAANGQILGRYPLPDSAAE